MVFTLLCRMLLSQSKGAIYAWEKSAFSKGPKQGWIKIHFPLKRLLCLPFISEVKRNQTSSCHCLSYLDHKFLISLLKDIDLTQKQLTIVTQVWPIRLLMERVCLCEFFFSITVCLFELGWVIFSNNHSHFDSVKFFFLLLHILFFLSKEYYYIAMFKLLQLGSSLNFIRFSESCTNASFDKQIQCF